MESLLPRRRSCSSVFRPQARNSAASVVVKSPRGAGKVFVALGYMMFSSEKAELRL